jgi:hypothetical protein
MSPAPGDRTLQLFWYEGTSKYYLPLTKFIYIEKCISVHIMKVFKPKEV